MRRLAFILATIIWATLLSGCATVNRGITDYFRIDSVPQGAKATTTIETRQSKVARRKNPKLAPVYHGCEPTPCAIGLYRRSEFVVKLEQEGYEPAEMYITNSSRSGSFTANMAATTATATGTAATTAALNAAVATSLSSIGSTLIGATFGAGINIYTFGLVPAETAISTGISLFSPSVTPVSSTAAASSAIPPALMITGGMLLTDAALGSNVNLYPNPVVLKMAPEGTPIKTDPNVAPFKKEAAIVSQISINCPNSGKTKKQVKLCSELNSQLKVLRAEKKAAKAAARKAFKEAQRQKIKANSKP